MYSYTIYTSGQQNEPLMTKLIEILRTKLLMNHQLLSFGFQLMKCLIQVNDSMKDNIETLERSDALHNHFEMDFHEKYFLSSFEKMFVHRIIVDKN